MKRSSKFLIVFLAVTVVFSALGVGFSVYQTGKIRRETNDAVTKIASAVIEKYPQVTREEIAVILNGRAEGDASVLKLERYGIDADSDWAVYSSGKTAAVLYAAAGLVCLLLGAALSTVLIIYTARIRREAQGIALYIREINNKNYNLRIEENSEDDMSLLKNEICKTTVMLKEQSESSLKDKENLKDSLSDISHQLKTPLTSIMVILDTITDNPDMPQDVRGDFLKDIRREAGNMSFLVQSLLTLSKLDANTISLKSKPEAVTEIIKKAIGDTAVLAELKEVEVSYECSEAVTLCCDFKWLSQALVNVVKNCIEHTDKGGRVKITAEQQKLYTKITVEDNGRGISQKDLPHIFQRFYKGENSGDDSVGIGLALAKAITEKSGGSITADSHPDKGTRFEMRFFSILK